MSEGERTDVDRSRKRSPSTGIRSPGKIAIAPTKPMATQRDLSLAYSPGVAAFRCWRSPDDPDLAYDYTSKGNLVAVISNGTAILGLGDLGALAAKPVMEGKSVLFKRFADVDSGRYRGVQLEGSRTRSSPSSRTSASPIGGINLEDIKSPDCFRVETELQELLDIPVFHDDQHGTAIISCGRPDQRLRHHRTAVRRGQAGALRRRRRRNSLGRTDEGDGRAAGELHRPSTTPASSTAAARQGMNQWKSRPRRGDRRPHPGRRRARRGRLPRPLGEGGPDPGDGRRPWLTSRSSSPWPIPIPRSPPRRCWRSGRTPSSPPAAPTIPTRSTMSSASPTSSVGPWTCGRGR